MCSKFSTFESVHSTAAVYDKHKVDHCCIAVVTWFARVHFENGLLPFHAACHAALRAIHTASSDERPAAGAQTSGGRQPSKKSLGRVIARHRGRTSSETVRLGDARGLAVPAHPRDEPRRVPYHVRRPPLRPHLECVQTAQLLRIDRGVGRKETIGQCNGLRSSGHQVMSW